MEGLAQATATAIELAPDEAGLPSDHAREDVAERCGGELAAGRYALFEWDGRRLAVGQALVPS